ncbi:hypothetical protein [Photobacterium kishitanii]|uniref:Uncharacterized protein n=1 Tax=Photobacterium kishitanii TaxID=318456 RepID=A0A2T3KLJ8_9GAMM|nr:hypothetical protein [Photobacterium kishitanii]PSV00520.1 hypothetical protein C9J27_05140 [Photobacterium kishitanii]
MYKYQFFCGSDANRKNFTYLDMQSETFHVEKKQILMQGFVVVDDVIFAETAKDAVDKYKSNYIYRSQEHSDSYPESGFIGFLIEIYRKIRRT